jgi:AraC family transcriptional regulator, regulatory protein of adaptative response / methylated-DNA-[protein]-cysteine methyltransferase
MVAGPRPISRANNELEKTEFNARISAAKLDVFAKISADHSIQDMTMPPIDKSREYFDALVRRDPQYEGIVYYGIKTTGVFCRSTCTARKPNFENCEYFSTAQDALLAGYRPCKRCQPMSCPEQSSDVVKRLIVAIESDPEKRWRDSDFVALGIDTSTVRRQFKKRFGMTFVAYARARRMGLALHEIRSGVSVTGTQIKFGYESASGFRDAFSRILGSPPKGFQGSVLKSDWIDTPLGPMLAIAQSDALVLLEFTDRRGLEREIESLRNRTKSAVIPGAAPIIDSVRQDLRCYFKDGKHVFRTPIKLIGSEFQKSVWTELQSIQAGSVRSYSQQSQAIGAAKAVRAVAKANGANQLAIIVPCHRVIGANGSLTGYAGGLARKKWLLEHEGFRGT